jgi:sugar lactone lactonase YvrE
MSKRLCVLLFLAALLSGCNSSSNSPIVLPVFIYATTPTSVAAFPLNANGNVTPAFSIAGNATGLSAPTGVAFDGAGELVVSNSGNGSITIYSQGASGNATPARVLMGATTTIAFPGPISADASGKIYSSNFPNRLLVFAAGANGNTAPAQTITATGMSTITGIAVDSSGNIYVSDSNASAVFVFANNANGLSTPIHKITGVTNAMGVALDGANNLYVALFLANSVSVFPPGADGAATPSRTFATDTSQEAIAVDAAGTTFVAPCVGFGTIEKFAAGASGNVTPLTTITGLNTTLNCPMGLALGF